MRSFALGDMDGFSTDSSFPTFSKLFVVELCSFFCMSKEKNQQNSLDLLP